MDLAYGYLASTTHERNVAAADRINAYRRRVAERRALEAMSGENGSPDRTSAQGVGLLVVSGAPSARPEPLARARRRPPESAVAQTPTHSLDER